MGGDGQVVEVVAAVVGGEAGELALVGRREVERRLRRRRRSAADAAGDQRLLEPRADRLAAEERQLAVLRLEDAVGLGRAQPLEILVQRAVEAVALLGPVGGVVAGAGHFDFERRAPGRS